MVESDEEFEDGGMVDIDKGKRMSHFQALGLMGQDVWGPASDRGRRGEVQDVVLEDIEEHFDVDMEDPELDKAAAKIGATFKGKKTRREMANKKTNKNVIDKEEVVEEVIDIDMEDPETAKAATKIQASFKGKKARQEVGEMKKVKKEEKTLMDEMQQSKVLKVEEDIDIDMEDPEVDKAAIKIQATFKGHQARKEVSEIKKGRKTEKNFEHGDEQLNIEAKELVAKVVQEEINEANDAENNKVEDQITNANTIEIKEVDEIIDDDPKVAEIKETKESNMDEEKATIKIQSGLRGAQARRRVSKIKAEKAAKIKEAEESAIRNKIDEEKATIKIQSGLRGAQARRRVSKIKAEKAAEMKKVKESAINNEMDEEKATIKIQSGLRGAQARRRVSKIKAEKAAKIKEVDESAVQTEMNEEEATIKIKSESEKTGPMEINEKRLDVGINWDSSEMDDSATKLQAGYR